VPAREIPISVDIEASGPTPSTGSLIAVGACLVFAPDRAFYRELHPLSDRPWDVETERIHRLSRAWLAEHGEPPARVMEEFAGWVEEAVSGRAAVFVGFNAPFDWMFVADYFHRFLGRNPFGVAALDLKSYYMGRERVTSWEQTRRYAIDLRYPTGRPVTHHALDDARSQAELAAVLLAPP
jgi:DNA polymerase III epsilon subunit-like protein